VNLSSPPARLARALVNAVAGDEIRVVRVRSGVARGARLALDLSKEKAYWLGHYERPLQRLLRDTLTGSDLVFDVGAHVGFLAVCAARLGAKVVAVEPDAANARRLRRNVELNGLDVEVVEAAAWSTDGVVAFVRGPSTKEGHAVSGEGVESVTLDELVDRYGTPALVKLDVEGAEAEVLGGARRLLAGRDSLIVCEIHGAAARERVLQLLQGYTVRELDSPDTIVARP